MTDPSDKPSPLSRRRMFAGVGSVGALAAAAAVLPLGRAIEPARPETTVRLDEQGGYQATEHVLHYYRTARV